MTDTPKQANGDTGFSAHVEGQVQGVGFRAWVSTLARSMGIRGYVRNNRDGSVDVLAIGPRESLTTLVERLREGPPEANVRNVQIMWGNVPDAPAGFEVR
ncbi:MAG: acylphosphatase [Chloroflexota bacterium]